MIALVDGASRQKTPNELALDILIAGLTLILLVAVVTLQPMAVRRWVGQAGGTVPADLAPMVERIAASGGTPLVVADGPRVLGVIHLKDTDRGTDHRLSGFGSRRCGAGGSGVPLKVRVRGSPGGR